MSYCADALEHNRSDFTVRFPDGDEKRLFVRKPYEENSPYHESAVAQPIEK